MRKRVKVIYSAERGLHVDLPTYDMVAGSFLPLAPGKVDAGGIVFSAVATAGKIDAAKVAALMASLNLTVEVDVPDDDCDCAAQRIDVAKIHKRYPAWKKRAAPDV